MAQDNRVSAEVLREAQAVLEKAKVHLDSLPVRNKPYLAEHLLPPGFSRVYSWQDVPIWADWYEERGNQAKAEACRRLYEIAMG